MRNRKARIVVFLIAAATVFGVLSQSETEATPIKPLSDRVIVKVTDRSGNVQKAEVIAVGPGRFDCEGKHVPLDVDVGHKVLFSKYAGTEMMVAGEDYIIIRESDILAIIDEQ